MAVGACCGLLLAPAHSFPGYRGLQQLPSAAVTACGTNANCNYCGHVVACRGLHSRCFQLFPTIGASCAAWSYRRTSAVEQYAICSPSPVRTYIVYRMCETKRCDFR